MHSTKKIWIGIAAAVSVFAAGRLAAQSPMDFPTLKGGNSRTGHNGDPNNSGPGRANFRWGTNASSTPSGAYLIDNTDTNSVQDPALDGLGTPDLGPLPLNNDGEVTTNSTWSVPQLLAASDEAAEDAYNLIIRPTPITVGTVTYPRNTSFRRPPYVYTRAIPSNSVTDPRGTTALAKQTFTWTFHPTGGPGTYGMYVWLPVQPTWIGGRPAGVRLFPQRYYVYDVKVGTTVRTFTVDTYTTGGGFVRLGTDDSGNNEVFTYDGTTPIQITLYNTTPRRADGTLMLPVGITDPNQVAVYADAALAVPSPSSISATPVSARLIDTDASTSTVTAARNERVTAIDQNGLPTATLTDGVVTNYQYNTGAVRWRYSPLQQSQTAAQTTDNSDANVAGTFVSDTVLPRYSGTDALTAPIDSALATATATYTFPISTTGSYSIWAYIPGSQPGVPLGRRVLYTVRRWIVTSTGRQAVTDTVEVDQSTANGWVQLSGRYFHNPGIVSSTTTQDPIVVTVTNASNDTNDHAGARTAYADAIRVVGEASRSITSTPVYTTALIRKTRGAEPEETKVVLVADEAGIIHCLDAAGYDDPRALLDNPGTTAEYWSYPSTRDSKGYDPNLGPFAGGVGLDGTYASTVAPADRQPTAVMPSSGFNLSSAVVDRVREADGTLRDRLYIGATNGRVYCIDMTGRGDFQSTDPESNGTRIVGTTSRIWTFPATYPSNQAVATSSLGAFQGSVVIPPHDPTVATDAPVVLVPTRQGRLYKLDAIGNSANKTTTIKDAFPALNQPTIGSIVMTPSVEFGRVYFGTTRKLESTGEVPGEFFALNLSDLSQEWIFRRTVADTTGNQVVFDRRTDDFISGPVTVSAATLNLGSGTVDPDTVYALNQNRVLYAFDAATGAIRWATDELGTGAIGSLTYTRLTIDNVAQGTASYPMIMVPAQAGSFFGMYARQADVNRYSATILDPLSAYFGLYYQGKGAWGRSTVGDQVIASLAVSNGWMFGADNRGYLYAYNNDVGVLPGFDSFIDREILMPDDPRGDLVRKTKVRLITASMYRRLRRPEGDPNRATYAQALANANSTTRDVFEWGETAYVLVYDFPYLTKNPNAPDPDLAPDVDPPLVNVSLNADGRPTRPVAVQARRFETGTVPKFNDVNPLSLTNAANPSLDGYAILAIPLNNAGSNAVPPGSGEIAVSIQTAALTSNSGLVTVALDPSKFDKNLNGSATGAWSRYPFLVANPLAIQVTTAAGAYPNSLTNAYSLATIVNPGNTTNLALRAEALTNGTPPAKALIGTAPSTNGSHGQTVKAYMRVYDRSYMGLLRPGGVYGLDNIRIDRRDLARQGGKLGVFKPIDSAYSPSYNGYEDYPTNFPNSSLNYPDLARDAIRVTKDPNGASENPVFGGVALKAPTTLSGAPIDEDTLPQNRRLVPTEFEFGIDVPKYQPAATAAKLGAQATLNSGGGTNAQGYMGRVTVLVDQGQNGQLDLNQREAYRSLNLSTGVDVDERISVVTPTVDLGPLSGGAGLTPFDISTAGPSFLTNAYPGNLQAFLMHPWPGSSYGAIFKTFQISNEGNVNLLNLRVAKASRFSGARVNSFLAADPDADDPLSWLNGFWNVHSNLDFAFSPGPDAQHRVFLQKPRVQDRVGTQLKINPVRRENPNLGTTGAASDVLNPNFPTVDPQIGVTVPIGQPVGNYTVPITVFEDTPPNDPLAFVWNERATNTELPSGAEPYLDKPVQLTFTVTESRLTNGTSANALPMVDQTGAVGGLAGQNAQPSAVRDANGSLIVAWTSNRALADGTPAWLGVPTTGNFTSSQTRIYLASLDNRGNFARSGLTTDKENAATGSPLRDLNVWAPWSNSQWFRPSAGAPFPGINVFTTDFLANTIRFDSPAFSGSGAKDPYDTTNQTVFRNLKLAFLGRGTRRVNNTSAEESRLFVSDVRVAADGTVTPATPTALLLDPQVAKSEPSVLQTSDTSAIVFYTGVVSGQSWVYTTRVRPDSSAGNRSAFTPPTALPIGNGFTSVSGLSVAGRWYTGANENGEATAPYRIADMTFTGNLRGRPYAEVFMGRAAVVIDPIDGQLSLPENADHTLRSGDVFLPLAVRTNELLERESSTVFRARGVAWRRDAKIALDNELGAPTEPVRVMQISNGNLVDILIASTRKSDRETGIITYETRLGGTVAIDPSQGTLRFTTAIPAGSSRLYVSYQPYFLRVSESGNQGGASAHSSLLYDGRYIPDDVATVRDNNGTRTTHSPIANFWFNQNGRPLSTFPAGVLLTNDRYVVSWGRLAAGNLSTRPFTSTLRVGLDLGRSLPSLKNGAGPGFYVGNTYVNAISRLTDAVTGNTPTWFQIDPANGRIYLPAEFENHDMIVEFYAVNGTAGTPTLQPQRRMRVGLVTERPQEAIPLAAAVNESNLASVLDPFSYPNDRRPPLIWYFWSSTRGGVSDIYFQTVAPKWNPVPISN